MLSTRYSLGKLIAHSAASQSRVLRAGVSGRREKSDKISALDENPKSDKPHLKHWKVSNPTHPMYFEPIFENRKLKYTSYNPPHGFTAEEIFEFKGAKKVLETVETVREIIADRERLGTLDLFGDEGFGMSTALWVIAQENVSRCETRPAEKNAPPDEE